MHRTPIAQISWMPMPAMFISMSLSCWMQRRALSRVGAAPPLEIRVTSALWVLPCMLSDILIRLHCRRRPLMRRWRAWPAT